MPVGVTTVTLRESLRRAIEILQDYHWPGNVRELQNLVESMVVLAPGRQVLPGGYSFGRPGDCTGHGRSCSLRRGQFCGRWKIPALRESGPSWSLSSGRWVDLRMDVDDLRKEFETYRSPRPGSPGSVDTYPVNEGRVEIGLRPAAGVSDEPWEVGGTTRGRTRGRGGRVSVGYDHGGSRAGGDRCGARGGPGEPPEGGPNARHWPSATLYRKIKAFQIDEEEAEST